MILTQSLLENSSVELGGEELCKCLLLFRNWSLLENSSVELGGEELDLEVDWVRLYRILQAEQTALLSNRRWHKRIKE